MDRRDALSAEAEPFLARWSRRKQEAREQGTAVPEVEPAAAVDPAAATPEPGPEPTLLTDEDMPPIESLTDDADYSGFLSPGVSELLRGQALKRLFSSAKFNVTDGLDDFAEDYTQFAPLGDVVTADMKHQMERLLDRFGSDDGVDAKSRAAAEASDAEPAAAAEDEALASSEDAAATGHQRLEQESTTEDEPQRPRGTDG